jgi:hypothetical protein
MSERDEFPLSVKRLLQGRSGNLCANPGCQRLTSGPNYHPDKVTLIGVAAHISAATQGGPRFDSSLSSDDRKDSSNGIWLCQNCARLIDVDEISYGSNILGDWKAQAEEYARKSIESPNFKATEIQEFDNICCPHCGTWVKLGVQVCVGCYAEIFYAETPAERKRWGMVGGVFGFLAGMLFTKPLVSIAQDLGFIEKSSDFYIYYLYAVAAFVGLALASGIAALKWYVKGRTPMFVRYSVR